MLLVSRKLSGFSEEKKKFSARGGTAAVNNSRALFPQPPEEQQRTVPRWILSLDPNDEFHVEWIISFFP